MNRSPLRLGLLLIPLVLACFAIAPAARAVLPPPPPDGGYLNGNTAEGGGALFSLTIGTFNTAIGVDALFDNTGGSLNTATGALTLFQNTGDRNTATGALALFNNTTGVDNVGTGMQALTSNTTGVNNVATGNFALFSNTIGFNNTSTGHGTLITNGTGNDNTANGAFAMTNNSTGSDNTANGLETLFSNTTGSMNTANGTFTLFSNTTGINNTADGFAALINNTGGSNNTVLGSFAGNSLTTGSNNIDIGNAGNAGENNTIRIGTGGAQSAAFIAGISGVAVTGSAVLVSSAGQLGVAASSARFKDEIKPMDKASEAILALKPVTFHYKKAIDPEGIPQFGLVAEDVQKVSPALITRDRDGKPYTVRYEAVNAMLLNEFLKEHQKVEDLKKDFQATIAQQQKQIEALTAGLQKVSAQVQMSRSAPQTVADNH
jgi:hypothetical protein